MTMTALEICSEVYGLSGFGVPSAFANSGDTDDRMIFFLLRRVARDISKYRWQQLVKTLNLAITPDTQEYLLPNDFREFIPNSIATVGDLRPVNFPTDFATWAQVDAQVGITGINHKLRLQGDRLVTLVGDSSGYTIRADYISGHPVQDGVEANTTLPTFEKDSDIWLLDDDLIIKGLKAKWSMEKGLETIQADIGDFNGYLQDLKGTQAMSQKINMSSSRTYMPSAPYTNTWK